MTSDEEAPPAYLYQGRLLSLDGLRALAVLLVLCAHVHQTRGFPDVAILHTLGSIGSIGVDVFFVISGFLITNLMLREVRRTNRLNIGQFYLRRVLRILPAYVGLLAVVAILQSMGY